MTSNMEETAEDPPPSIAIVDDDEQVQETSITTETTEKEDEAPQQKSITLPWLTDTEQCRRFVQASDGSILAYSTDGIYNLEGKCLKTYTTDDDDDEIKAVAMDEKRIALALESGCVHVCQSLTDEESWIALSTGHAVRDLAFCGPYLIVATEASWHVLDADKQETLRQEEKGYRSITCYEGGILLIDMDGNYCAYDTTTGTPSDWTLVPDTSDTKNVAPRAMCEYLGGDVWERVLRPVVLQASGKTVFLLPGEAYWQVRWQSEEGISVLNVSTENPKHGDRIISVAHQDRLVASGGRDSRVLLWSVDQDKDGYPTLRFLKEVAQMQEAPTHLFWGDKGVLYAVGAKGAIQVFSELTAPPPAAKKKAVPKKKFRKMSDKAVNDDDDDDDDMLDFSQPAPKNDFVIDEAAEDDVIERSPVDDDGIMYEDLNSPKLSQVEDSNISDEGDENMMSQQDDDLGNQSETESVVDDAPTFSLAPKRHAPQAAFCPSSTPLELTHRILCWNQIGTITLHQNDEGRPSVSVHFTASATRRPVSFTDTLGLLLGSLGEDGAIFCTDVSEDDNAGSTVYFHRFETFSSAREKDWHLTLANGERAMGCAAGEGWAAVMTSRRFVRLFSSGGNQDRILWLEGEPVTMVGRGRMLAVIYHRADPLLDGTQQLGYMLYDTRDLKTVHTGALSCISSAGSLTWVGLDSDSSLVALDSSGMISMLIQGTWSPMLDTVGLRKSVDDRFWPIAVKDGKFICVPLKGGTQYPDAARRPVTATLIFRMPMARGGVTSVNALEELTVRASIAISQKREREVIEGEEEDTDELTEKAKEVDKVILKTFAKLLENNKQERALDMARRLHTEPAYDLAIRLAANRERLVELIEDAQDAKFGSPEEDDFHTPSPDDEDDEESVRVTPEGHNKRSLAEPHDSRNVRGRISIID